MSKEKIRETCKSFFEEKNIKAQGEKQKRMDQRNNQIPTVGGGSGWPRGDTQRKLKGGAGNTSGSVQVDRQKCKTINSQTDRRDNSSQSKNQPK